MYKNFLYASVVPLIVFIIWVGVESIEIKIALGIIGLTFIPKIRIRLYKTPLVIRKSKVALYSSFLLIFLILIFDIITRETEYNVNYMHPSFIVFVFLSCLLGSFIYGIPVSLFSDLITANVKKYRFFLSLIVHIGFGLLSFFFLGHLMLFATFLALLFFLIDEFFKKRECTYSEM
ncbi:hypothetical protein [Planococcus shixiaomingii]|uniref:hypothetical protein n=1 Tax=Planococcus shixiaomingii TaxID=3058393 RepID=UPI00262ACE13|nr:hypothetical protein [Planococcus sp. N022]WKA56557.1 hypothetical protein QWY21_09480 [Planococcus sp. N022]